MRKEGATQRKSSRDMQKGPLKSLAEYLPAQMWEKNTQGQGKKPTEKSN